MPTSQPVSSPPLLPCRYPGPGPSVPSPSCPEPRLSRVSKLTPAHNTPHEAISRLFYPQAAPATDSYFTHDQEQPHQSTALLRVVMEHLLTIQVASGSPLHSAPVQPSRARPQQHAYRGGSVRWCGRPRRCVSGRAVQQGCSAPCVRAGWSGCGRVWSAAAIGRLCGSGRSSEAAVRRTFRLLPPLLLVAARWVGALAGCSDSGI